MGTFKGAPSRAFLTVDDQVHARPRHIKVAWILDLHRAAHFGIIKDGEDAQTLWIHHFLEQMWGDKAPVVGEHGMGLHQLDQGRSPIALADANRDGIAHMPRLLIAAILPLARGVNSQRLFVQVDAGRAAKAVDIKVLVNGVDSRSKGDIVEVGISRELDGAVHIKPAVTPAAPIAETVG